MKRMANKSDEKGQALLLVLILLLVGSLIITPLLSYMSTGLKTGQVYEKKTDELYAADAGIEDALWRIQYDYLGNYDVYDYTTSWPYDLREKINGKDVNVTIENAWIPKELLAPDAHDARLLIEGTEEEPPKLVITSSVPTESTFNIKITYYPEVGEDLTVETLGIWLPPGFHYDEEGDCNLGGYDERIITPHASGEAVVWHFSSYPFAGSEDDDPFPYVDPEYSPMTSTITFQFDGPSARTPQAVSWIETNLYLYGDIKYTWDADTKVFKIISVAGDTEVEAYCAKSELRKLGSAISGDYRAIGNSLMIRGSGHGSNPRGIRYELLDESDAAVGDIPSDAQVQGAYLYWSAWLAGSSGQIIFEDDCRDFSDWSNPGSDWGPYWGRFRGHHLGSEAHRYLTMQYSLDLSSASDAEVRWTQSESGRLESDDCLKFAFSGDGGGTWGDLITAFCNDNPPSNFRYTIPDEYLTDNFKMRFYLKNFGGSGEYVYIDNIKISVYPETIADTLVTFKINSHQEEVTASEWSVLENQPGEYSYACYADVTELVQTFSDNHTGNGEYTVGDVYGDTGNEWSYAAWSLIIIYSSPETKGHQLYLYDDFVYSGMDCNVDFDGDGEPGGTISGFLVPERIEGEVNAAKLTCFVGEGDDYYDWDYLKFNERELSDGRSTNDVWNSWSYGLSEDGIDIDTFYITWSSGLLEPGNTSAQVDLPTKTDSWNLVYIILSFRSETTTGGTITYLIRG